MGFRKMKCLLSLNHEEAEAQINEINCVTYYVVIFFLRLLVRPYQNKQCQYI